MRSIHSHSLFCGIAVLVLLAACSGPEPELPTVTPGIGPLPQGLVRWQDPNLDATWASTGQPLLLFLSTRRSFWSVEMVRETFTVPEVVSEINVLTQPVWIDADLRPDLVDLFSLGALPSLAVLTSDRKWITGTTFLEREDMVSLLRRIRILVDIPERSSDLERARRRLLARRPFIEMTAARSLGLDVLLDVLVDSIEAADVTLRSGEAQVLLTALGRRSQTKVWLDTHASDLQTNSDGLYVASLRSEDGRVRDEMTSLGHNAGLLHTMAVLSQHTEEESLRQRTHRLADAIVARLYDDMKGGFYAGTADYVTADSGRITRPDASEPAPIDKRVFTAWNALVVSALCEVARLDPDRFSAAEQVKTTLDRTLADAVFQDDVYRTRDRAHTRTLEDAAHLIRACLDYADLFGDDTYTDRARVLADRMVQSLDSAAAQPDSLVSPESRVVVGADAEFGSPAGVFAQSLFRLAIRGDEKMRDRAESIIRHAILMNAERLPRLGAAGRALYLSRSLEERDDEP